MIKFHTANNLLPLSVLWQAPLLGHLVSCAWAQIPKAVPWEDKFHLPSTWVSKTELVWEWRGWGGKVVSVHVMIQKRKMEICQGLIIFLCNSQFAECYCRGVSCFCSVQESKYNLNIHVHITTLQKLTGFFKINKWFNSQGRCQELFIPQGPFLII